MISCLRIVVEIKRGKRFANGGLFFLLGIFVDVVVAAVKIW